jgi:hypothetical protein
MVLVRDKAYATMPMAAVMTICQTSEEENLFTSFESAISERASTLHGRLSSQRVGHAVAALYRDDCCKHATSVQQTRALSPTHKKWQSCIILVALALSFTMLGFDLMGLLVLYAR